MRDGTIRCPLSTASCIEVQRWPQNVSCVRVCVCVPHACVYGVCVCACVCEGGRVERGGGGRTDLAEAVQCVYEVLAVLLRLEALGQGDAKVVEDAFKVQSQEVLAGYLGGGARGGEGTRSKYCYVKCNRLCTSVPC